MLKSVKHIDYEVTLIPGGDVADEREIINIVSQARADWEGAEVQVKLMSGGFINSVFKTWNKNDAEDTIAVRVFTSRTTNFVDTRTQLLAMRVAEAAGCGAEVLASFTNGIIYKFVPGDTLDPAKYDSRDIRRLVAGEIAKLHHFDHHENGVLRSPRIWDDLKKIFAEIPETLGEGEYYISDDKCFATKAEFSKEIEWIEGEVNKVQTDVVFGHGDTWWGNIIYNQNKESVQLIDYDLGGYNFLALDLARYVLSARFQRSALRISFLTEEEEKDFLIAYLEMRLHVQGRNKRVAADAVNNLYGQMKLFKLLIIGWMMGVGIAIHHFAPETNFIAVPKSVGLITFNKVKQEYLEYIQCKPVPDFSINDL